MRVIICGAGIAGLTLAWWLQRSNWDVLLIDHADGPRDDAYMLDLAGSGYDVVARMGLLPQLHALDHHISEVTHVDQDGRQACRLRYSAFGSTHRANAATVMRGDVEHMLRTALHGLVKVGFGLTVRKIRQTADDVRVVLSDGSEQRADLLVGADGLHSRVRRLVFGPENDLLEPLGYETAAFVFKDDTIDREVDGRFTVLTAPGLRVGIHPLGDGALAASFVHQSSDQHLSRDPAARLREVYGGTGWVLDEVLDHCPAHPFYDQVAQTDLRRWSQGRVALVGDAAAAVSMFGGQGAALAMGSAFGLTAALYEEPDIHAALHRYEASVRPEVTRKQAIGRRVAKWVVPDTQWRITMRNAILTAGELPGMSWLLQPVLNGAKRRFAPPQ